MTGQPLGGAIRLVTSAAQLAALTGTDGQTIAFQDDTTLVDGTNTMVGLGVRWIFQYNGRSASASKWELVGGPPLYSEVVAQEQATSNVYGAIATAGPLVALPLAGDYYVTIGAEMFATTATDDAWMSYDIGATAAVDADGIRQRASGTNVPLSDVARTRRKNGLSAVTLTMKYRNSVNARGSWFGPRFMEVLPARVG